MIGVVGGGQLAMLLVEAGKRRDVDVVVQTSAKTDPAAKKTKLVVLNDPTNAEGTKLLAEKSRLITFENEWVDIPSLLSLQDNGVSFIPRLQSISPLINKITQRELLNSLDIPCPDWLPIPLEKSLKIDLPSEVSESVYNRMRTERERLAKELRAQGKEVGLEIRATADKEKTIILADAYMKSEQIKGNGDAQATSIYANAYNKDPEFYDFTRSLKAYQTTFESKQDILLIDPESDFFKYLDKSSPK